LRRPFGFLSRTNLQQGVEDCVCALKTVKLIAREAATDIKKAGFLVGERDMLVTFLPGGLCLIRYEITNRVEFYRSNRDSVCFDGGK
jgi:hypothetical protein